MARIPPPEPPSPPVTAVEIAPPPRPPPPAVLRNTRDDSTCSGPVAKMPPPTPPERAGTAVRFAGGALPAWPAKLSLTVVSISVRSPVLKMPPPLPPIPAGLPVPPLPARLSVTALPASTRTPALRIPPPCSPSPAALSGELAPVGAAPNATLSRSARMVGAGRDVEHAVDAGGGDRRRVRALTGDRQRAAGRDVEVAGAVRVLPRTRAGEEVRAGAEPDDVDRSGLAGRAVAERGVRVRRGDGLAQRAPAVRADEVGVRGHGDLGRAAGAASASGTSRATRNPRRRAMTAIIRTGAGEDIRHSGVVAWPATVRGLLRRAQRPLG